MPPHGAPDPSHICPQVASARTVGRAIRDALIVKRRNLATIVHIRTVGHTGTMRHLLIALALAVSASPAIAQVSVQISFPAPPPLVVVSPGVQVVPEYEHEVFFSDGYYWHRAGTGWYRTADYHGGWEVVEEPRVPVAIVRLPPGRYKKFKPGKGNADREEGDEGRGPEKVKGNNGKGHGHGGGGKGKKH